MPGFIAFNYSEERTGVGNNGLSSRTIHVENNGTRQPRKLCTGLYAGNSCSYAAPGLVHRSLDHIGCFSFWQTIKNSSRPTDSLSPLRTLLTCLWCPQLSAIYSFVVCFT